MQKILLLLLILLVYVILIAKPIRLTTGDLGRHLKNGELIATTLSIPRTNLFTYTNGDYPFINHHWGSGVIFYLIHHVIGFRGLHIFLILLSLVTFLIFFNIAWKYSNFYLALWLSLLSLPLLASRPDLRPEIFSNFFSGIFFWILFNYQQGKISAKYLILLPIIQPLWVNLHIYFFLGLIIIAAFTLEAFIRIIEKSKATLISFRNLFLVLISSFMSLLANPFGVSGATYPLKIFSNYGFKVGENISALAPQNVTGFIPNAYFIPGVIILLLGGIFTYIHSIKFRKPTPLALLIISFAVAGLGAIAIRNFALFGYFALAIIAINIRTFRTLMSLKLKKVQIKGWILLSSKFLTVVLVTYYMVFALRGKIQFNIDLERDEEKPGEFFIENKIQGPIFNDFDIGGYLIYYLYPKYQLFIDNRPEAVPAAFFKDTYIPILEDNKKWQTALNKYNFNAIFFYRLNRSEPVIKFLITRINDPEWVVVFVDNHTIIFLKENDLNRKTIEKYQISKDVTLIYASSIRESSHETVFY